MGSKLGTSGLSVYDEKLWGNYRAIVLDNNDPLKQGRIKAEVIPYFVGIESSIIPWAVPKNLSVSGAGIGYGSSFIPDIGTKVWVFFEMGDVYQPVYDGEASDGVSGLPSFMLTGYPNTRGFQTSSGIKFYINDLTQTVTINHPSGSSVVVDVTGDVAITSLNKIELDAPTVDVNGNLNVSTGYTGTFTTQDGKTVTVANGIIINIEG